MSKTKETEKMVVDWELVLQQIAEEKKQKSTKEWKVYKLKNLTLLLNVNKNFIKIGELDVYIANEQEFKFLLGLDIKKLAEKYKKTIKKDKKTEEQERREKIQNAVRFAEKWDKKAEKMLKELEKGNNNILFKNNVRGLKKEMLNWFVKTKQILVTEKTAVFAVNSKNGLTGIYQLFKNFRGGKKSAYGSKIFLKGSIKGLITLNANKVKTTSSLVIGESIIDVLSYVQLKNINYKTTTMLATGGTIGKDARETFIKLRDKVLKNFNPNVKVVLTFDKDEAGQNFAEEVKEIFENDFEVINKIPINKDFNEDLMSEIKIKQGLFRDL